jgi:hypothetical protein
MKNFPFILSLCLSVTNLFGQTDQAERLLIPFLAKESQSNIIITISDIFGNGRPCTTAYTNSLSNTNLFTPKEQELIRGAFVKYIKITTNSGPSGTKLVNLYKTNTVITAMNRTVNAEWWVGQYRYTNSDAMEEVTWSGGLFAKFRTKSNDGYNVHIGRVGTGSSFRFMEIKNGLINGLLVEFQDFHAQSLNWDYKASDFSGNYITEYRQYTNGMVLGKYLMWNKIGNLIIEADFKEPYDFEKHRIELKMFQ